MNVEYPGRIEIDRVKAIYQHSIVVERANKEIPEKRVSPVKITREMLTKNGYDDERAYGRDYDIPHNAHYFLRYYGDTYETIGIINEYGYGEEFSITGVHYVHELQHAFRVLEMTNQEADFKID